MPKPKKKKPLPAVDDSQPSIMDASIDTDPSKGSAARPSPVVEPPPPPSPGGLVLKEAKRLFDEAIVKARALENLAKKYKAEERKAERLCDAKFKRAESKQKRKPKNPYGRCVRMYEALNVQLQANLKAVVFDTQAARADARAFTCRVAVLQLENARLKRQLRRYC